MEGLVDLARRSRRARPSPPSGTCSPDALRFFDYEQSATWIGSIELLVMPGLLQTADYARAVMTVHDVGAEKAQRFVRSAGASAGAGRPDPPALSFIIDESVLLRPSVAGGDAGAAGAPAERRGPAARRDHVIPLALGEHVGLRGPFVLLRFSGTNDPDVVYIEQRRGDAIFRNEIE